MELTERDYSYRAAFFGAVAVAVPYLMRVEGIGKRVLRPLTIGSITLPGSLKPLTASLLSGFVALHYLFKRKKRPPPQPEDRSEEERLRRELEELQHRLDTALRPAPPSSEEGRWCRERVQMGSTLEEARSENRRLQEEVKRFARELRVAGEQHEQQIKEFAQKANQRLMERGQGLNRLLFKLNELKQTVGALAEEKDDLEHKLRRAESQIQVQNELLSSRLPNNGYCIEPAIVEQLEDLQQEVREVKALARPPDDSL